MNSGNSGRRFGRSLGAYPIIVFIVTIVFCLPSSGQTISNRQLARLHLPNHVRDKLAERFRLFIQYEKAQSYDKQFELLAKKHLANLLHMEVNKESYVKFKQESQLAVGRALDLRVRDIKRMSNDPDCLSFSVVVKLQKGQSLYSDTPILVGCSAERTWYFSLLYIN
jgi:hypothetical protein